MNTVAIANILANFVSYYAFVVFLEFCPSNNSEDYSLWMTNDHSLSLNLLGNSRLFFGQIHLVSIFLASSRGPVRGGERAWGQG